jgi:formate dehydrogenase subunit delta
MKSDRLVRMANQIAAYFSAYPHEEAVSGITDHLKHFWEPRMLTGIKDHVAQGGAGLNDLVPEAVRRLS